MTTSLETFLLIAPEIALVVAALVVFLSGAFANLQSGWPVAVAGIAIAMFLSGGTPDDGGTVTSGPVSIDGFSLGVRWLVLVLGGILALVTVLGGAIFGFQLGTFFSVAMVGLAGAAILYDTSNVLHPYPEDRYVAASLELFASVALMLWYVLRLLMSRR